MILFFLILFLIAILFATALGALIYIVIKTYSNKKYAKYSVIIYSILILFMAAQIIFEDQFFSKKDALELINEQNLYLEDDFKIIKNESFDGIGDYYHTFELEISEKDKIKGINEIKNSKNFTSTTEQKVHLPHSPEIDRYNGKKLVQNFETENGFVREYFRPNGQGYAPTYRTITFDKKGNKLIFQDIDH